MPDWEKQLFYCGHRGFRVSGLDCDNYFQNGNGQQCPVDCQLRQTKQVDAEKTKPDTDTIETKICSDCGEELPIAEFGRHAKSSDGHRHICPECVSKKLKKPTKPKNATNRVASVTNEEKSQPAPIKPSVVQPSRHKITLDFSKYPAIYDDLIESAGDDFRTPEMQVMAILNRVFNQGL